MDKDTPAAEANLRPGLVVTSIDGRKIDDIIDAARIFHSKKKGDEVTLNIVQMRQRGIFVRRSSAKLTLRLL